METNRVEAFSDGVLAIIITIMILELSIPVGDSLDDLLALMPTLVAYLLSFFFIAIYWVNHHMIFHMADYINVKILWCNIVWLFVMSFIPFGTGWVGSHPTSVVPLTFYFADMALACYAFHLMYYLIVKEKGIKFKLGIRNIVSIITYTLAAVLGGFFPVGAFIVVALVSAWWIIPTKKKETIKE